MQLPIQTLVELDTYIFALSQELGLTNREEAIVAVGKLLISLTHDEHYNQNSDYRAYKHIADVCNKLSE